MDIRLTRAAVPVFVLVFGCIVMAGIVDYVRNDRSVSPVVDTPSLGTVVSSTSAVEPPSSDMDVPVSVEEVPGAASVRMLFVGDIMLDRNVAKRAKDAKDPAHSFRKLPDQWFASYDYAVANLEGPVTDKRRSPEKSIDFLFDPSVIPVLKEQGIDALSQANNHALDQGSMGYADSVARLREAGFLVFGHQVHDDQLALATTTVRGRRFAFLGFNTTDNPLDRTAAEPVIRHAREQADEVIVMMHWGPEYRHTPSKDMVELGHWFIDKGVDLVIGGHPHWVQGIERYKGKPIVYSLGNFIFDQDFSRETTQGLAIEVVFDDRGFTLRPIPLEIVKSQVALTETFGGDDLAAYSSTLAHDQGDADHQAFLEEIKRREIFFSRLP